MTHHCRLSTVLSNLSKILGSEVILMYRKLQFLQGLLCGVCYLSRLVLSGRVNSCCVSAAFSSHHQKDTFTFQLVKLSIDQVSKVQLLFHSQSVFKETIRNYTIVKNC